MPLNLNGNTLPPGYASRLNALSLRLEAEGHPAIGIASGTRSKALQEQIFRARYIVQWTGNGPYGDVRWWDGNGDGVKERWVRVNPGGTVLPPGESTHQDPPGTGSDLTWPYNDSSTAAHRRLVELAPEYGIRWTGADFDEAWHFDDQWDPYATFASEGARPFDPIKTLEDSMSSNPIINVVPKNGDDWRNGTLHIALDDGSFQKLQPPYATNIRGILGKAFYGGDGDENKDIIPTFSQPDFNALAAVWATMCKGRTDVQAIWSQGVHAQDSDGYPLYIDADGKITTTKTDKPLKFTAAGFLASTNAVVNELAKDTPA